MQTPPFIFEEDLPLETVAVGVTRKVMGFNNQIMMVKVFFETGSEGYVHSHFHSQVAYVESGKFEVMVGGDKKILKSGDCFFMEPNIEHGAVCLKKGVLIDVFSPMREDFLKEK